MDSTSVVGSIIGAIVTIIIVGGGALILWGRMSNKVDTIHEGLKLLTSDVGYNTRARLAAEPRMKQLEQDVQSLDDFRGDIREFRGEVRTKLTSLSDTLERVERNVQGLSRGVGRLASGEDRAVITKLEGQ